MSSLYSVSTIARYEARLLFRSWGFRIFSGLTLVILTLIMVILTLAPYSGFYFSRALSGVFPLIIIKLLNVFQGIMAVIIAAEFLKRDRKQDSTEVIYAHSFANGQYIIGKFIGIFSAFAVLNIAVLLIAVIINLFFSRSLFAGLSYLLYAAFLSVPTLVFIIGLTIFLGFLIRSQAIVYLLTLSYVFLSLIVIGPRFYSIFDGFAFHTPIFYSDFIGLGNLRELLLVRGAYFFLGLGLALGSTLLMKRLRQSPALNRTFGSLAILFAASAFVLGYAYLRGKTTAQDFREAMKTESQEIAETPTMTLLACDIRLRHEGKSITAAADLTLANNNDVALKTIVLSLNPGLQVSECKGETGSLPYKRNHHLLSIDTRQEIEPGKQVRLSLSYSGMIDERYCYLDIDDSRRETPLRIWFVNVPKRYAVLSPEFVHLTPECGWYPRPGLPESLLFPSIVKQDYCRYTLTVTGPESLTAISQGLETTSVTGHEKLCTFQPEVPLPQISLTMGRYEQKSITVDGIRFSLFLLAGHDQFTSHLAEIAGELPQLIKQIKDGYEVLLGLNYPYKQFSLVEVPLHVTSYNRLWTSAQEQVQPQLVFLPEMGAFCTGAEFRAGIAIGQRAMALRAGAGFGPKDIQRQLFNRFVQANLTSTQMSQFNIFRRGPLGIRVETNSEASFNIFPNFFSYTSHFGIGQWPLLGYAVEAYLQERVNNQPLLPMRLGQQNSVQEQINKYLQEHSLAEALRQPAQESLPLASIMEEKGKYLLTLIKAKLGTADFDERLIEFLKSRRFQPLKRKAVEDFVASLGRLDLDKTISDWYQEKGLPGFLFENVQSYRVIEGEKTKFQIKFQVANPTDLEGVVKVNTVTRGGFGFRGGGGMGGQTAATETRTVLVPARTVKDIGIVLDQVSVMTTIDTAMSKNLPGAFIFPFSSQSPNPGAKAFDGESAKTYIQAPPGTDGEYIVDNEDKGFVLPSNGRENWLRSFVRRIFIKEQTDQDYMAVFGLLNPPENWQPVIMQNFYGRFVRSAYVKKSGQGTEKVVWTVNLKEPGNYNIYYYNEGLGARPAQRGNFPGTAGGSPPPGPQFAGGQRAGGRMSGAQAVGRGFTAQRLKPGKKHFLVHYEDGAEEVVIDLEDAQAGWNLIGNFRLLAGENRIELTDKNDARFVLADAIKWVQQK